MLKWIKSYRISRRKYTDGPVKNPFHAFRNGDDGCQFVEAAVKGVHFPPVRARDNLRRRGVPANTDQLHNETAGLFPIF